MIRASIDSMCRGLGVVHLWYPPGKHPSDFWRWSLCGRRALLGALHPPGDRPNCRTCARVARLAGLKEE